MMNSIYAYITRHSFDIDNLPPSTFNVNNHSLLITGVSAKCIFGIDLNASTHSINQGHIPKFRRIWVF